MRRLCFSLLPPLLLLVTCGTGCLTAEQFDRDMQWGYVYEIGSARQITQWTLAQDEKQKVVHGLITLSAIPSVRPSAKEARDAVDGYVAVHRKLMAGWPGMDGPFVPDAEPENRSVLELSRFMAFTEPEIHPDNAALRELWRRVSAIDPVAVEDYRRWLEKRDRARRPSPRASPERSPPRESSREASHIDPHVSPSP